MTQYGNRDTLFQQHQEAEKNDQLFELFTQFIQEKGLDKELNDYLASHWKHEDIDLNTCF